MRYARNFFLVVGLFGVFALLGCEDHPGKDTGSATVSAVLPLSATDIDSIEVEVSGAGMTTITADMTKNGDVWEVTIGNIPVGEDRVFKATAYDTDGEAIYDGEATTDIEVHEVAAVEIYLQEINPTEFQNHAPVITGIAAVPAVVTDGGSTTVTVTASDPDGEDLTYAWTASGGTITAGATTAAATWEAPLVALTDYTLTVTVTDENDLAVSADIMITVTEGHSTSSAEVEIVGINTAPEFLGMTADKGQVGIGDTVQFALSVQDSEQAASALSFVWSTSCEGSFSDPTAEDPSFELSAFSGATCTFTVIVSDGVTGSSNRGELILLTGEPAVYHN